MNTPGAKAGRWLAIVSLVFFMVGVLQTFDRYRVPLLWKSTTATVVNSRVASFHDGQAVQRFRVTAELKYHTTSGEQQATAESDFASPAYAHVRSRQIQLARNGKVKVYYDSSKPGSPRFGAEASAEYLGTPVYFYWTFVALAVLAIGLRYAWKAPRSCTCCKNRLKHHFRHCPFCGASLSTVAHPISHERAAHT
jgi:hypothetical protein